MKTKCTLLKHHSAFPGMAHGLQRVVCQFTISHPWKSEFREGEGTMADLQRYNALDVLKTAQVNKELDKTLSKPDIFAMDNLMADIAINMHMRGIPISLEENKRLEGIYVPRIEDGDRKLRAFWEDQEQQEAFIDRLCREQAKKKRKADSDLYEERVEQRKKDLRKKLSKGKYEFNPDSHQQLAALLLILDVPLTQTTKTGAISTKKDILEGYSYIPIIKTLLDYRDAAKLYRTYIRDLPTRVKWDERTKTHRLHVSYSVAKITGRWSTKPGTQAWTKEIRSQVESPVGYRLVGADYAQLEARIIALLSGDEFLLDIFNTGQDLHTIVAEEVIPGFRNSSHEHLENGKCKKLIEVVELSDRGVYLTTQNWCKKCLAREVIKNVEYAAFYGATAGKLWVTLQRDGFTHVTMSDVCLMLDMIEKKMPGVVEYRNELVRTVYKTRKLESGILKRERCFPVGDLDIPIIYNSPVQMTGADIMDTGLALLVPHLPDDSYPILQIHDAIVVECKETDAPMVKNLIVKNLTQTIDKDDVCVTFPVEAKDARTWDKL